MEPARIDWNSVESVFIEEAVYENINAPKWVDFLNTSDDIIDDELWFCKPDCNHPKTADDFLPKSSPIKLSNSVEKSERENLSLKTPPALKRSGKNSSFCEENSENQNPNFETPPIRIALKDTGKCSDYREVRGGDDTMLKKRPKLKSTMSASNLFGGKSVLSHLTELYSEVKKIAGITKEKRTEMDPEETKVKTPLLKADGRSKESDRNLNNATSSPSFRINPPLPQRFSSTLTPRKCSKLKPKEKGILQEVRIQEKDGKVHFTPTAEEERGQHVFWLFKPCTLN